MTQASSGSGRLDWLAGGSTVLSIVACYGTLLVISVLSLLGVGLALHTGAWAGVIVFFAGLAVVGTALGYKYLSIGSFIHPHLQVVAKRDGIVPFALSR